MNLIINDKFKNSFKYENVKNLINHLNSVPPDYYREKERRKIWHTEFNGYEIFVKNFNYPNIFIKKIKGFGTKNYNIAKFFLKNSIKTPEPIFFYSFNNNEYFSTVAINNSIDLWEFLTKNPSENIKEKILSQLREMIQKFEELNIYHSDFNIRNLILNRNTLELYILDLEAVRFNFNSRRKAKMIKKINKYLSAFQLSI